MLAVKFLTAYLSGAKSVVRLGQTPAREDSPPREPLGLTVAARKADYRDSVKVD